MDCVDLRLYLAGQGQPGDRHVGVQHLELGLQRQSHAGGGGGGKKNREKETSQNPAGPDTHTQAERGNTTVAAVYAAGDVMLKHNILFIIGR